MENRTDALLILAQLGGILNNSNSSSPLVPSLFLTMVPTLDMRKCMIGLHLPPPLTHLQPYMQQVHMVAIKHLTPLRLPYMAIRIWLLPLTTRHQHCLPLIPTLPMDTIRSH